MDKRTWKRTRQIFRKGHCQREGCYSLAQSGVLCLRCREKKRSSQRRSRSFRTRIGLCIHCRDVVVPGFRTCTKHRISTIKWAETYAEKKRKKRGWKLVKVKI